MPPPYINPHWNVFAGIPYMPQGPVGVAPDAWVLKHGLVGVPAGAIPLPAVPLDRAAVRAICQNPANPVLFGYVCAMAWGGQGSGPGGAAQVANAWANNVAIAASLNALLAGGLARDAAFGMFLAPGAAPPRPAIPYLGPSFFTKLLYFFSPLPNFYIMDSRVAQAVMLLTGNCIAKMPTPMRDSLGRDNNTGNYRAFCEEVDLMAGQLACTGQEAEERLFSRGGKAPWPWRAYVDLNWPAFAAGGYAYNPANLNAIYPHIPVADF